MARNLGPKSTNILRSAGISTMDELRRVGAVRAYSLARAADAAVSLNLLWALEGAILGEPWQSVAREHRTRLLMGLDDHQRHRAHDAAARATEAPSPPRVRTGASSKRIPPHR